MMLLRLYSLSINFRASIRWTSLVKAVVKNGWISHVFLINAHSVVSKIGKYRLRNKA